MKKTGNDYTICWCNGTWKRKKGQVSNRIIQRQL